MEPPPEIYTVKLSGIKSYSFNAPTDLIGEGKMAKIYKAISNEHQRVAIKVLKPENEKSPITLNFWKNNAEFPLKHKNLMQVYEEIHQNNRRHIVLEYIDGADYEKVFNNFNIDNHLYILIQVLEGLKGLHSNSYIHRDIKPSNILVEFRSKFTKIIDYDLVMNMSTKLDSYVGTPKYSSPESMELKQVDQRADLWSVGIILYQIFNKGKLPFQSEDKNEILNLIYNSNFKHGEYSNKIKGIINKALNPDINKRYKNADEIIRAIKRIKSPTLFEKLSDFLNGSDFFSNPVKIVIVVVLVCLTVILIGLVQW